MLVKSGGFGGRSPSICKPLGPQHEDSPLNMMQVHLATNLGLGSTALSHLQTIENCRNPCCLSPSLRPLIFAAQKPPHETKTRPQKSSDLYFSVFLMHLIFFLLLVYVLLVLLAFLVLLAVVRPVLKLYCFHFYVYS